MAMHVAPIHLWQLALYYTNVFTREYDVNVISALQVNCESVILEAGRRQCGHVCSYRRVNYFEFRAAIHASRSSMLLRLVLELACPFPFLPI